MTSTYLGGATKFIVDSTIQSSSITVGSIIITGGLGCGERMNIGGDLNLNNHTLTNLSGLANSTDTVGSTVQYNGTNTISVPLGSNNQIASVTNSSISWVNSQVLSTGTLNINSVSLFGTTMSSEQITFVSVNNTTPLTGTNIEYSYNTLDSSCTTTLITATPTNVYSYGTFTTTVSLGYNTGTKTMECPIGLNVYSFVKNLSRFGDYIPNYIRLYSTGTSRDVVVRKVVADTSNNLYITFNDDRRNVAIDNGTTVIRNTPASSQATGNVSSLVKVSSDGTYSDWVNRVLDDSRNNSISGLAIDSSNSTYVCGEMQSTRAGIAPVTKTMQSYAIKYNNLGVEQWGVGARTSNLSYRPEYKFVTVDSNANVYVLAKADIVAGTINLYSSSGVTAATLTNSPSDTSIFVVKYNPSGIFQWIAKAKSSSAGTQVLYNMRVSPTTGETYATSQWPSGISLVQGNGTTYGTYVARASALGVLKLNSSGSFGYFVDCGLVGAGSKLASAVDESTNKLLAVGVSYDAATTFNFYNADGTTFATSPTSGANRMMIAIYNSAGVGQFRAHLSSVIDNNLTINDMSMPTPNILYVQFSSLGNALSILNSDGTTVATVSARGDYLIRYNIDLSGATAGISPVAYLANGTTIGQQKWVSFVSQNNIYEPKTLIIKSSSGSITGTDGISSSSYTLNNLRDAVSFRWMGNQWMYNN